MNTATSAHINSVNRVYSDENHSAFTDMCRFNDRLYLCFRTCPDGHGVFSTSSIIIMASSDGSEWTRVHSFNVPNRDTRDPHFLIFRERLFLYTGTWLPSLEGELRDLNDHLGYAVLTKDGRSWEGPHLLEGTYGHYIWRAASFGQTAYLCGRRRCGFRPNVESEKVQEEIEAVMLESDDGLVWRFAAFFNTDFGNETAFLFEPDGSVLALARGGGPQPARICRSSPPYAEWSRTNLDRNIGGPLLARWGNRYLVGGRKTLVADMVTNHGAFIEGQAITTLYWLQNDILHEIVELPSAGDNSYPGFIEIDEHRALVSYYSSHEGQASIYLANLNLT